VAIVAFQLAIVVLQGMGRAFVVKTTLGTSILTLVATLVLAALSDFEHCRTTRPSILIQAFLIFKVLLDMVRVRTEWFLSDNRLVAILFSASFALHVVLLQIESLQKWKYMTLPPEAVPPEERQGIFGLSFFTWLNPLFREGYNRDLTMDDLPLIDDKIKGEQLHARLLSNWKKGKRFPGNVHECVGIRAHHWQSTTRRNIA